MTLLCDNKSAICMPKDSIHHGRTKHVEISTHFTKEQIEERSVSLLFAPTSNQTANIFTNPLLINGFTKIVSKLSY